MLFTSAVVPPIEKRLSTSLSSFTSRIDAMEDKLAGGCDEFLGQAKAYLDLEGKR